MAGNFSDYLESLVLNHLFRDGAFVQPASLYLAAFTAAPGDAGGGTEVAGNDYERVEIPLTNAAWNAPGDSGAAKLIDNINAAIYPQADPAGYGTVVAVALFDDPVAGNLWIYGNLNSSKLVQAADILQFAAGQIDITLS